MLRYFRVQNLVHNFLREPFSPLVAELGLCPTRQTFSDRAVLAEKKKKPNTEEIICDLPIRSCRVVLSLATAGLSP